MGARAVASLDAMMAAVQTHGGGARAVRVGRALDPGPAPENIATKQAAALRAFTLVERGEEALGQSEIRPEHCSLIAASGCR